MRILLRESLLNLLTLKNLALGETLGFNINKQTMPNNQMILPSLSTTEIASDVAEWVTMQKTVCAL